MEKLLFGNPEFKDGVNITVRDGSKWDDKWHDGLREVELCDNSPEQKSFGKAKLVGAVFAPFYAIPEHALWMEHAENCRSLETLFYAMQSVYPGFTFNNMVTVLFFIPEKV